MNVMGHPVLMWANVAVPGALLSYHPHMTSAVGGVEGVTQKADAVREAAWILYFKSVSERKQEGLGGCHKIPQLCGRHIWTVHFVKGSPPQESRA